MGIKFTEEQQQVIDCRNCNILVSAAAGSGKTAVLVERIITRLTKDQPRLSVDELLIVTFTEAAAAEMKERIQNAIEKKLEEHPEDEHLQTQAALIHNAQITTIHSFCLSVIREYFHTIDLEPGFRVADDGEMELMKHDTVNEVLEQYYADEKEEFIDFVESYVADKKDDALEEMIIRLSKFASGYPNPEEWLDSCVAKYQDTEPCFARAVLHAKYALEECKRELKHMLSICDEDDGPKAYIAALQSDLQLVEGLLAASDYEEMSRTFSGKKWEKKGTNRGDAFSEEKRIYVSDMRDEVKKKVDKIADTYFDKAATELVADMQKAAANMSVFVELVKRFQAEFRAKKQSQNIIDFNDMEHYAYQILQNEAVAEEYRNRFAEIMVDEYQDSSLIQESLLTAVSRGSCGEHNVFMVGDVKQSIYSFRLARPDLFMGKYNSYSKHEGEKRRIDLRKNFRSRREVLGSTNFLFHQIMQTDLGGIDYDDDAALYLGAKYEEDDTNEVELLLLEREKLPDKKEAKEWEARLVARRIKELIGTHMVTDKATGERRPATYGDIALLLRGMKDWGETFGGVLAKEGIPVHTDSRSGYYETMEIKLLMDYLRVLDNPYQDIPLVAVLHSAFGKVTNEELAQLKESKEKIYFYDRILAYAEDGKNPVLLQKLQAFLRQMENFRSRVCYLSMQELLRDILQETGYGDCMAAMPGGQQRRANLLMLLEKAAAFEKTSYKGLFHFVRYIEQLKKYDVDCGEASMGNEQMQAVRMMTIHGSKGLEFPIVIVAGLGKQFNMQDIHRTVAVHAEWGVGIQAIDYERRIKTPTLIRKIVQREMAMDMKAEEMRNLYVAMTRAKEKLIMTGVVKELEKKLDLYEMMRNVHEPKLFYSQVADAVGYMDWILPAFYRNHAFDQVLNQFEKSSCFTNAMYRQESFTKVFCINPAELAVLDVEEEMENTTRVENLSDLETDVTYDADICQALKEQMNYRYPYQRLVELNQKMSVSELKKRAYMEEEGAAFLYEEEEVIPLLPKFLQEQEALKGASKGTAYHRFLELLDFEKEQTGETLKQQLAKCVAAGKMTEEMADAVQTEDILKFLECAVAKRMQTAAKKEKLYLEQPFMLGVPVTDIYPETSGEEVILVQGIIDAYFEEDSELVVVDYKTDRVKTSEELVTRYHAQLEYYAKALAQLTGKNVKQKLIYSFALQQEIEV